MTSSGIGGLTPILTNSYQPQNWYGLVGGVFVSAILAYKANNILNHVRTIQCIHYNLSDICYWTNFTSLYREMG